MTSNVTELFRYPVKSCRGEQLDTAAVEPWGLAGDRRWMIVDEDGEAVTARAHPRLVLITALVADGALRLSRPGADDLEIEFPDGRELSEVSVWRNGLLAAEAADAGSRWFSDAIGSKVRLVYLDDPTRRRPDPDYSQPRDRVSLADGYPLLLTTSSSLIALDELIAAGPHAMGSALTMKRFRPNVVISGSPAWAEDGWRRIRIGAVDFRVAKGCARCVRTTIDPDTAVKGHEPLFTLARHRRWDSGVWFGINLIPELNGPIPPVSGGMRLSVGDPVEIIE